MNVGQSEPGLVKSDHRSSVGTADTYHVLYSEGIRSHFIRQLVWKVMHCDVCEVVTLLDMLCIVRALC